MDEMLASGTNGKLERTLATKTHERKIDHEVWKERVNCFQSYIQHAKTHCMVVNLH